MIRRIIFSIIVTVIAVILQSTVVKQIAIQGITPDFAMLLLIFISYRNGSLNGQITGFVTGLTEDFLSLSPLGFHTLLKTVIGYMYGNTYGRMFIDPIFTPVVFAAVATFIKALLAGILAFIFNINFSTGALFSGSFWIELALNSLLAPLIFALTGILKFLNSVRREAL